MSLASMEISSTEEPASTGGSFWQHHRSTILTVILFVILFATGFFSALVYMLIRYLWLRLVRDPFLSPTDNLPSVLWEMFTTCPPNSKRTWPTIFFLVNVANEDNKSDDDDDNLQADDDNNDIMEQEREKAKYLDENRREARQRLVLIAIFYAIWTGLSAYSAYNPKLVKLTIPVPKLPAACDGYKLAMASDLHLGSMSGVNEAKFMVQKLNDLEPDGIALVGDVGDQTVNSVLKEKLAPLADLKAEDGVFYTFGNHENKQHVEAPFKDKIVLLENEHTILSKGGMDGCQILLLGMADWSGFGTLRKRREGQVEPSLTEALHTTPGPDGTSIHVEEGPSVEDLPVIMMQHQPKNMTGAAEFGVGLQLSGHTHGGQLWPQHFVLFIYDAISGLWEYDVGKKYGPSYLFVSEGIVGYGPRLRFLSKTDYALLTLRSPAFMNADGLEPDTHITYATMAMYFAWIVFPISLLACMVPCCCWAKSGCKTYQPTLGRSSGEGRQLV